MKKTSKNLTNLSSFEYSIIDKALLVVLSIYDSDNEDFAFIKKRFSYLFDSIDMDSDTVGDLCIKVHENRNGR